MPLPLCRSQHAAACLGRERFRLVNSWWLVLAMPVLGFQSLNCSTVTRRATVRYTPTLCYLENTSRTCETVDTKRVTSHVGGDAS